MAYNLGFIDPKDFLRDSQPGLLENFEEIASFISQDHEAFGSANEGKHKQLTLNGPTIAQGLPSGVADALLLFQTLSGRSNERQLFYKRPDDTLVNFSDNRILRSDTGQVSWISLPSGIVIKWTWVPIGNVDIANGIMTYDWPTDAVRRPFNNQYWAAAFPEYRPNGPTDTDIDTVPYLQDITNPARLTFKIWQRNAFNTPYRGILRSWYFVVAIGD